MNLETLMQRLEKTGARLDSLESAVVAVKDKIAFWRRAALIAGGLAILFGLAYFNLRKRYERERNQSAL